MYDLIGDIHGHVAELKQLLTKMDYQPIDGVWRHPHRKVIFLGDFVDRGPAQVEVVAIARAMVENGHALAVMGNHEFNAVAWATPDPDNPGQFLRPHTDKNRKQHRAFLEQVGEGSDLHASSIDWFKTLPLFLELPEFRVVHACWHAAQLNVIQRFTDDHNRLRPDAWIESSRKGSAAYEAVETLLKGLEIPLPDGAQFFDKDKNPRSNIRTKWWATDKLTYRDLAMVPGEVIDRIPHTPVPEDIFLGYDGEKPVFVGHYWPRGTPAPLNAHVACLDYSVAGGEGGKLCAYRFDGEKDLEAGRFCWVEQE